MPARIDLSKVASPTPAESSAMALGLNDTLRAQIEKDRERANRMRQLIGAPAFPEQERRHFERIFGTGGRDELVRADRERRAEMAALLGGGLAREVKMPPRVATPRTSLNVLGQKPYGRVRVRQIYPTTPAVCASCGKCPHCGK